MSDGETDAFEKQMELFRLHVTEPVQVAVSQPKSARAATYCNKGTLQPPDELQRKPLNPVKSMELVMGLEPATA